LDALEKRGLERGSQSTTPMAKMCVYTMCILAWAALAACIWLPYTNTDGPGFDGKNCANFACWSRWFTALWIGLSRPVWCLALLVLTLACYFEYTPVFNAMMSAGFWNPLSNLTYGVYLVHPPIIKLLAGNADDFYTFSPMNAMGRASWNIVLAYCSAIVLWCIVEKPCATLTGWLVPKKKPVKDKQQTPNISRSSSVVNERTGAQSA